MKTKLCCRLLPLLFLLCCVGIYNVTVLRKTVFQQVYEIQKITKMNLAYGKFRSQPLINLVYIACGETTAKLALVSMKTALYFTNDAQIKLHILTDLPSLFQTALAEMENQMSKEVVFQIYPAQLPYGKDHWATTKDKQHKQCLTLVLFLPELLQDTDFILYVDGDTLFLDSAMHHWKAFDNFSSSTVISQAHASDTYMKRKPWAGEGFQSGVVLMSLSRIRRTHFNIGQLVENENLPDKAPWNETIELVSKYRTRIGNRKFYETRDMGDQDVFNIIFQYNPDKRAELPCNLNYFSYLCQFGKLCFKAKQNGIKLLHGSGQGFVNNTKFATGKVIFDHFASFNLASDFNDLKRAIQSGVDELEDEPCKYVYAMYMTTINRPDQVM